MDYYLILFIFFAGVSAQNNYTCTCDTTVATDPSSECTIEILASGTVNVLSCTCTTSGWVNTWTNVSNKFYATCESVDTNVTRCNTEVMSDMWKNVTKYAVIGTSIFVIIVTFLVIFMNCKSKGPHRTLQLFEEIALVFLFLAMGILQFFFLDKATPCKIVTIVTQFMMTFLSGLFLMEGYFAQGMINYRKPKNAGFGTAMNLVIPLILALIVSGATFAIDNKYYGKTGLSCHAVTNVGMMYGFILPVWILCFTAGIMAQRGLLKCKKVLPDADENQVYWGYKSAKALVPFSTLIVSIYVLIMFGLDQQRFYILLLAAFLNIILAFYIYAAHTFCYRELAMKKAPGIGGIYRQCPDPNKKPKDDYNDDDYDEDSTKRDKPPQKSPAPIEPIPVEQPPKV
ncbi:unnamed protein product, partial [Mesorhabditis belari]|uniref:Uncharacterized protein n=1 Tax=Mesorhabditis belari TaxID=2138241 RepID=A0AAF3FMZ1_9BILA